MDSYDIVIKEMYKVKQNQNEIENLVIESRPEFITSEKLMEFSYVSLTVAIGLEVADEEFLKKLRKGITLGNYENAANILHDRKAKVKTYLLDVLVFLFLYLCLYLPFFSAANRILGFGIHNEEQR